MSTQNICFHDGIRKIHVLIGYQHSWKRWKLVCCCVVLSPSSNKTARGKPSSMISVADEMQWNSVQMIQKRTGQSSETPSTLQQWTFEDQYRKHKDWFDENDEEIQGLIEEKHQKHKAYLSDTSSVSTKVTYSNIHKIVQTRLRDMQDSWLSSKAEIQFFVDRKDMKKFFDALKTVYGHQSSGTTPLLSADGTSLLTDKEAIFKRWTEHFDSVLNQPSSIIDDAINRLPQVECNLLLDKFPTVTETVKTIKLLSSGKSPGSDAIPAEIYNVQSRRNSSCKEDGKVISDYVEKRSHLSRIQGCVNYPLIQMERESLRCVIIIMASLYCQLLERSSQEFYLINWMNTNEQSGLLPES